MIDPHFVILGALLSFAGSLGYAVATVRGRTQPNRVTWLLWALAPLIAFSAQLSDGVGLPAVLTLSVGVGPLMIFVASFVNRDARWDLGRLDVACGALSALALILWALSGSGTLAICLSILADALAAVPTIAKAWSRPASEHHGVFRNAALNGAITLLTVDRWNFASFGFALYILLIASGLYALIRFSLGPRWRALGDPLRA